MAYQIPGRVYRNAKKIGVKVKPAENPKKKVDVFNKKGEKVATVGARGMNDYPTYLKLEREGKVPKGTAKKKQKGYKARMQKNRTKRGTNGYFADKLFWD